MSAVTVPTTLDITRTTRVPMSRLVHVELRKSADTRAGRWLLGITVGVVFLVMTIMLLVVTLQDIEVSFTDFIQSTGYSSAIFLPILGILLVTQEWGQRTAMNTFTLEPHRERVFIAKLLAAALLAAGAVIFGLVAGTVMNLIYASAQGGADWDMSGHFFLGFVILQLIGVLSGFALGALFLNTPAAIVVFFVYTWILPVVFGIGAALMNWFEKVQPWIDFANAQIPFLEARRATGEEWAQLAVTGTIWFVLPLAIGMWRAIRSEVK